MKKFLCILFSIGVLSICEAQTWIQQGCGIPTSSRGITHLYAVDSQIVWATTQDGSGSSPAIQDFTHTSDGGTSWTAGTVNNASGLQIGMITAVDASTAWVTMYYVEGSNSQGIYKTTNGGASWTRQTTASFSTYSSFPDIVYFWDSGNGVCIGDPSASGEYEIYTTTNGGTTWTAVSGSFIPDPLSGEYSFTGDYCVYGNNIWFGTNEGRIYHSTDKGYHWSVASVSNMSGLNVQPAFRNGTVGVALNYMPGLGTGAVLASTSNGGNSYAPLSFTGDICSYELKYVPMTLGTYVTVGTDIYNDPDNLGLSWSYDGGSTWIKDVTMDGTQVLSSCWVDANTGWIGLYNTGTSDGIYKLIAGGTPPVAAFTANVTTIAAGGQVQFQDQSTGNPASRSWSFPGGTPSVSSQQNPLIQYATAGTYDVSLQVTNSAGSNTHTEYGYITVNPTGPVYLPPVNLQASVSDHTVQLTWDAPSTPPTGYDVYRDGVKINGSLVVTTSYSEWVAYGLYQYSVYAVYGSSLSPPAGPLSVQTGDYRFDIGTTLYDLQSNASMQPRFCLYPDGSKGTAWIFSNDASHVTRGTGYAYNNGTSWTTTNPTSRIESLRTGWPSYQPWNGNGEIVIAHQSESSLLVSKRTTRGTGTWQTGYINAPSGAPALLWPHVITSGPTHNIIHMLTVTTPTGNGGFTYQGQDGALLYYRSQDGGNTWDRAGVILEQLNSSHYPGFNSDNYAWGSPHGDTLVFAVGAKWTDTFLMVSYDNGNTWTKIPVLGNGNIWQGPYDFTLPFYCCDGSLAVEMDHEGIFHLVFGRMRAANPGTGQIYYPYTDGLVYWNSTMNMLPDSLDPAVLEANGQLMGFVPVYTGTIGPIPYYGVGMCSYPSISVDDQDHIYVIWSGVCAEAVDPEGRNFRHLMGRTSWDHGNTWGDFTDLTSSIDDQFLEFVFPSMAKNSDDAVHLIYQYADVAGSNVKEPTVIPQHVSHISYRRFPKSLFPVDLPAIAPVTTIATVYGCSGSAVNVPVTVNGFSGIHSVTLRIEYDPALATLDIPSSSVNVLLTGATIQSAPAGSFTKITISWTGTSTVTLPDGSTLATLVFSYPGGAAVPLAFNNTDHAGQDCEYTNASGTVLTDVPTASYYVNGQIEPGEAGGVVLGGTIISFGNTTGDLTLGGFTGNVLKWQSDYNGEGFLDIPGTAGATVYNEAPVYTGTWKYRAAVQAGSCPVQYSVPATVIVTTPPGNPKIWTGNEDDDWRTPLNWDPPGLPFSDEDVEIHDGPNQPVVRINGLGCHNIIVSGTAGVIVQHGISFTISGNIIIQ